MHFHLVAAALLPILASAQPTVIPDAQLDVVFKYCIECHDELTAEGDLNLDVFEIDWSEGEALEHWSEVYTRIDRSKMPPRDEPQPSAKEKEQILSWLDQQLIDNSPIGGAPLRRLNRREIFQTLKELFPISGFELPLGFPPDNESHGFDTVSEALVISPSHLEAYRDTATQVADYLFPQPRKLPKKELITFGLDDFAISYSSAFIVDDAMRLASTGILTRNGTWLSRFEARESGTYRVTIDLSTKNPPKDNLPQLHLQANNLTGNSNSRSLGTFIVQPGETQTFTTDVELYRGETLVFAYKNAPLDYSDKAIYTEFLLDLFTENPALAAAWLKLDTGDRGLPRGGTGWDRVKIEMALNPKATSSANDIKKLASKAGRSNVNTGETIVFKYFEEGPNIGVHAATIEGPFTLVEDDALREQAEAQTRFLGKGFAGDDGALNRFFSAYLGKAFRRPATTREVDDYIAIVKEEQKAGYTLNEGLHLAVRTSLLSSNFLYKESGSSQLLPPYELAARLSYFLTSSPPDFKLMSQAKAGTLTELEQLAKETRRLIKEGNKTFAEDFTSQWLDTKLLDTLMPDSSLLKNYNDNYRLSIQEEAIKTFQYILTENQPLTDFISPDYLFTNPTIGWEIYELEQFKPAEKAKPKRGKLGPLKHVSIPKGTRRGGLLGMPAVMLATANGVDTQPVLRGVWMLENIIGRPPPEPPNSVPALSPDLSGANTLRERLNAHMADASCASCHEDIDPVGFVLENFDAVGRWRTEYPAATSKGKGLPVDATGVLPEGTPLKDVTDLKQWLEEHPEYFSNCLAEKLMIYATGRAMNHGEKRLIESIVEENIVRGNRFEDLLIELVQSEVFRAR